MAITSPLTGAPIPEASDAPADLLEVPDMVLHAEPYWNMRFTSTATRDAAIPVPVRGMVAVVGTAAANSFQCWYDGSAWRSTMSEAYGLDSAPVAVSVTATEVVSMQITVPAKTWGRTALVSGQVILNYNAAGKIEAIIYAGATIIGRTEATVASGVDTVLPVIARAHSLSAGAGVTLQLRVARLTGAGTITGTVSTQRNTMTCTTIPV